MKKKICLIILILIFITGCDPPQLWTDIKNLKFTNQQQILPINITNSTNQTTNITNETAIIQFAFNPSLNNVFVFSNSILIVDNNLSYIIDIPKENPKVVNYLQNLNIKELEFVASTIDKDEHNGGISYIVSISPPKLVLDNGVENSFRTDYLYKFEIYNKYWNRTNITKTTFLNDFSLGKFDFFVPYSRGLSIIKEENSIVALYDKKILYMSDCYGRCETRIPPVLTKYFILANNGKCPTNSFEFILGTGARYVIGDEICPDLKSELDIIGIKQLIGKEVIHLILKEEGDEIIYG